MEERTPSAAMRRENPTSSRPRAPFVTARSPRRATTEVFSRNSAPARAAAVAISRSRTPRSTTWAFARPASISRGSPQEGMNLAPRTVFRMERPETRQPVKASRERSPAHWTGWPMVPCSSMQRVRRPASAQALAAAEPAGPAPATTTSYIPDHGWPRGFLSLPIPRFRGAKSI
jgi:hypothetical protein